jgi:hypothetical protein
MEELIKAVIVQAALDVRRGYKTRNRNIYRAEEQFFNYHTAKALFEKDIELLMFAFGISHRDAKTFLEKN